MRTVPLRLYLWSLRLPMVVHFIWFFAAMVAGFSVFSGMRIGIARTALVAVVCYVIVLVLAIGSAVARGYDLRRPTPAAEAIAARVAAAIERTDSREVT